MKSGTVQSLLEGAKQLFNGRQYAECLASVERILGLDSDNLNALLIGAAASVNLGRFAEAIDLSDRVLAREHDNLYALLNKSTALLSLNRYTDVLTIADRILSIDPHQLTAHMNKGTALFSLGEYQEALQVFDQVLALRPGHVNALINCSSALRALGQHAEALRTADKALLAQPDSPSALLNRAAALLGLQRYDEALETSEKLLARHSNHLKALLNKGLALLALKHFETTLQNAEIILTLSPTDANGWQHKIQALLGMARYSAALTEMGRAPMALQSSYEMKLTKAHALVGLKRYDAALRLVDSLLTKQPMQADAVLLKINLLLWLQRVEEALTCVAQGLGIYPDHSDLLVKKALVLLLLHRYRQSLVVAEQVLARDEQHTKALLVKGAVLIGLGRYREALQLSELLLARGVQEWQVYANCGDALAGLQRFDEAREAFAYADRLGAKAFRDYYNDGQFYASPTDAIGADIDPTAVYVEFTVDRLARCEWADYQAKVDIIQELTEQRLAAGAATPLAPFHSLSLPLSPALQLAVARKKATHIAEGMAASKRSQGLVYRNVPVDKLKIGYVSADFHNHPTAQLMRSLFKIHNRSDFEIYGYALCKDDGSVYYSQIKADCDHFADLTESSNAEAAQRIYQDGIHILVDLMGYTKYSRPEIFALQPAPVQVSYLGYPGTMGADFIPYVIADPTVLPPEQAEFFTEKPVYLPDCYQVNDRWQAIAETGITRAQEGLPENSFVFCCFNREHKLEPVMFRVWMRILKRVPDSVLWLFSGNDEIKDNLRREAEAHSVSGERLIFAGKLPKDRHLERHRLADLFLDTRIYGAHTTASDALWAGLPVLTCLGQTFPGRVGASLLQAVGLPELIVNTLEEYEQKAVYLATHPEELAALHDKLAANRLTAPLFDTERFVKHLEQAYRLMWACYQRGEKPQPIWVGANGQASFGRQPQKATRRFWFWPPRGRKYIEG